jgi:hypothetical protein
LVADKGDAVKRTRLVVAGAIAGTALVAVLTLGSTGTAQEPSNNTRPWQEVRFLTTILNSTRCFQLATFGRLVRVTDISVYSTEPSDVTLRARHKKLDGTTFEDAVIGVPLTKMALSYAGTIKVNALSSFVETTAGTQTITNTLTNVCAITKAKKEVRVGVIVSGVELVP